MKQTTLLVSCLLFAACQLQPGGKNFPESFRCPEGSMSRAWYETGVVEPAPDVPGLRRGLAVVVDAQYKASNFVSETESWCAERAAHLDSSDFQWMPEWETMRPAEKQQLIEQKKKHYAALADSLHRANNQGQLQVWMINNSKDTVLLQMQDDSYMCILQAKSPRGQWLPIEYRLPSDCGNSYFFYPLAPRKANSFIFNIPDAGDYATSLRFKVMGKDRFYYSNEFKGRIEICRFVENLAGKDGPYPNFKLDSLSVY